MDRDQAVARGSGAGPGGPELVASPGWRRSASSFACRALPIPATARFRAAIAGAIIAVGGCGAAEPNVPALPVVDGMGIRLVARDNALQPAAMTAPAGLTLHVRFDNRDGDVPHNVVLLADPHFATRIVASDIVTGPANQDLTIPGLMPGRYRFTCEVHPNMVTKLTVGG